MLHVHPNRYRGQNNRWAYNSGHHWYRLLMLHRQSLQWSVLPRLLECAPDELHLDRHSYRGHFSDKKSCLFWISNLASPNACYLVRILPLYGHCLNFRLQWGETGKDQRFSGSTCLRGGMFQGCNNPYEHRFDRQDLHCKLLHLCRLQME